MLDLDDDVVLELAVERMEVVVGSFCPIVLEVVPVEMMVVNESAVENDSVMRFECARDDVGGVSRCAMVERRAELPVGIGFDDEASEIGEGGVKSINFFAPTFRNAGIERIKCIEFADRFRAAQVNGNRKL